MAYVFMFWIKVFNGQIFSLYLFIYFCNISQPVYGFASGDPLRFKRAAGHKDLFYIEDKDVEFKEVRVQMFLFLLIFWFQGIAISSLSIHFAYYFGCT